MAGRWRMDWVKKINYGCREPNGSLRYVPPGATRRDVGYCSVCEAEACLFPHPYTEGGSVGRVDSRAVIETCHPYGKGRERTPEQKKEHCANVLSTFRAKGLNSRGDPLARSCWNCRAICQVDENEYTCLMFPEQDGTFTQGQAAGVGKVRRAKDCDLFWLRREVGIGPFPLEEKAYQRQRNLMHCHRAAVRKRAIGLGTDGQPLKRTCWNCAGLRCLDGGYVCPDRPDEILSMGELRVRPGCQKWGLRREWEVAHFNEIPRLRSE